MIYLMREINMYKVENEEVDNSVNDSTENDRFVSIMFDLSAMIVSAALLYLVYSYII